jgi:hypothetical protein
LYLAVVQPLFQQQYQQMGPEGLVCMKVLVLPVRMLEQMQMRRLQ